MFEALTNRGLGVDALNAMGLYTQGQVDELDKRVKELWTACNEAYAVLFTRVGTIEQMMDENYTFCGKKYSTEQKKTIILDACEHLRKAERNCYDAMFPQQS